MIRAQSEDMNEYMLWLQGYGKPHQELRGDIIAPSFSFVNSGRNRKCEAISPDLKAKIWQDMKHTMLCTIFCVCVYIIQI